MEIGRSREDSSLANEEVEGPQEYIFWKPKIERLKRDTYPFRERFRNLSDDSPVGW